MSFRQSTLEQHKNQDRQALHKGRKFRTSAGGTR